MRQWLERSPNLVAARIRPARTVSVGAHEVLILRRDGQIEDIVQEGRITFRSVPSLMANWVGLGPRYDGIIAHTDPVKLSYWTEEPTAAVGLGPASLGLPLITRDAQPIVAQVTLEVSVDPDRAERFMRVVGNRRLLNSADLQDRFRDELRAKLGVELEKYSSEDLRGNPDLLRALYEQTRQELADSLVNFGLRLDNFYVSWGLTQIQIQGIHKELESYRSYAPVRPTEMIGALPSGSSASDMYSGEPSEYAGLASRAKYYVLFIAAVIALVVAIVLIIPSEDDDDLTPGTRVFNPDAIHISMASSITKTEWLNDAVEVFNQASESGSNFRLDGKQIQVEILLEKDPLTGKDRHWNSPTQVNATLRGDITPTILSPASITWLLKLNKEWREANGRDISTPNWPSLLNTPVVIAMWQSRAEALGCWPVAGEGCTWQLMRELAAHPDGWGMVGHDEWKEFRFGYAYVGESDVGTQTAVLFCMTGLDKTENLQVSDVTADNACGQAIADIEDVIAHRGTSSPFLVADMASGGPAFLDAVTTYEKNVIGFNLNNPESAHGALVNVYPQDGTIVADHRFAIMDQAPWVTADQIRAAEMLREYLLSPEQQAGLVRYGLRPADQSVELAAPIDPTHGANPSTNLVILDVPEVLVVDQVVEVWASVKKPANVVLAFDKSGSMVGEKISAALNGAVTFVEEMARKDWLTWMPFDEEPFLGAQGLKSEVGEELTRSIRATTARGETALYDAIEAAHDTLTERAIDLGSTVRYGIVVLSDGQDTSSEKTLAELEVLLEPPEAGRVDIQLHAIGIGDDVDDDVLNKVAKITGGRYWKVEDPAALEAVYKRISKYW